MKKRLDILLTERGLRESRQQAQAAIMSGDVFVDGQRQTKPGAQVSEDAAIEVRGRGLPYVSRGGWKLEKALSCFPVTLRGGVCADIGASTGGFTDCMLQNGAAKVYAVDVGYGQLAWKLRTDSRVVCLERTNARYLSREQIPEPLDFASVDVSFISLDRILPPLRKLMKETGQVVCLVKPQFEAGRGKVGKRGVVRDPAVHEEVLEKFLDNAERAGFQAEGLTWSPIRGPEGNLEYLGFLRPLPETMPACAPGRGSDLPPGRDSDGLPGTGSDVPPGIGSDSLPGTGSNVSPGIGSDVPPDTGRVDMREVPRWDIPALVAASHRALAAGAAEEKEDGP